jgi:2,4-didehydro-3-deoxy-L-rhamnonate hydrolase
LRLLTYTTAKDEVARVGTIADGGIRRLPYASMIEALQAHMRGGVAVGHVSAKEKLSDVRVGPPVPNPGKIVCVGLNYRDHASETDMEVPDVPLLFAKFPSSVTHSGGPIELSPLTAKLDYEAELAVVVGRPARDVEVAEALEYVAGYMNLNDVSARDVQLNEGGQWTRGKSFDTFAPTGPYLVTADEIADPQDLIVSCEVNGRTVQQASTADMIFSVAELISFISGGMTLLPGDIIATGTPPGVGMGQHPPLFLGDGDEVVVEVAGLGRLVNHVQAV